MVSFIQRAHMFVSLSTTFAPSQSITQLRLSAWSVMADLCSTFVEHFLASRVERLDVTFSTTGAKDKVTHGTVCLPRHLASTDHEHSVPVEERRWRLKPRISKIASCGFMKCFTNNILPT